MTGKITLGKVRVSTLGIMDYGCWLGLSVLYCIVEAWQIPFSNSWFVSVVSDRPVIQTALPDMCHIDASQRCIPPLPTSPNLLTPWGIRPKSAIFSTAHKSKHA